MPSNVDELEAAILERPDLVEAYLVLADALSIGGDPRGQLIAAQHALLADPDRGELRRHEQDLRRPFDDELQRLAGMALTLDWHLGFVSRVAIDLSRRDDDEAAARLRDVLDHPSAKLLSRLEVRCAWADGSSVIGALGARERPALRALHLDEELGDWDDGNCDEETGSLWSRLPRLEHVYLRSERALFASIDHPRVTRMDLDVGPFSAEARWDLPALRAIDWDPHIESECGVEVLDVLWRQHLPALRDVTLRGELVTNAPLLDNPDVRRCVRGLDRLCLPALGFVDDGERLPEVLIRNAPDLAHLSRLIVFGVGADELDAGDVAAARRLLPNLELDGTRAGVHRGKIGFDAGR